MKATLERLSIRKPDTEFCPDCGARLVLRYRSKGALYCTRCDYKTEFSDDYLLNKQVSDRKVPDAGIVVVDKKAMNLRTHTTVSTYCEECGGRRAEAWTVAFGSNGLTGVVVHRCLSCGHTWRIRE